MTKAEEQFRAWQQLSGNGYVFIQPGIAFLDTKLKSRSPLSGTTFTSSDEMSRPALTLGYGVHMQRYFAFEISYGYIPAIEYSGSISASNANIDGNILDGNRPTKRISQSTGSG